MIRLDPAGWRRRQGMARLLDALGAEEGLTRYVGGAIRDDLLGIDVNDVDLATRIEPDEVVRRLEQARIKAVPTGIDHGTITAVSGGHPYEITTLRRDVTTDGRRATVAFTSDWKEDAARRDFTINALLADPVTGELFDFFGGLDDLAERRVRFIGEPLQRIAEDHLRILRFFRFHARFGAGEPDPAGVAACAARANDLMALSRERIADELTKLLGLPDPVPTLRIMLDRSILKPVLPEIKPEAIGRLADLIAAEVAAGIEPDAIRRIAALLPADPAVATDVAARLRLSNKAKKRLVSAAEAGGGVDARAMAYRLGRAEAADRLLLADRPDEAREIAAYTPPRLPLGGGDLIARGLAKGPAVARTLRKIEQRWIDNGFPTGAGLEAIIAEEVSRAE
ncbi:MAG: CCA tRNA nucleotidyltransferase [Sphingomicrobium sp.]